MKILLDTHVIIWALEDSYRLPMSIRDAIIDESNEIYVSVVSLWEIAIKHKKQPEKMIYSAEQIKQFCQRAGFVFLSLSLDSIHTYEKYDFSSHNDPFDQMLVAQSACNSMRLFTHDDQLTKYGVGFIELF